MDPTQENSTPRKPVERRRSTKPETRPEPEGVEPPQLSRFRPYPSPLVVWPIVQEGAKQAWPSYPPPIGDEEEQSALRGRIPENPLLVNSSEEIASVKSHEPVINAAPVTGDILPVRGRHSLEDNRDPSTDSPIIVQNKKVHSQSGTGDTSGNEVDTSQLFDLITIASSDTRSLKTNIALDSQGTVSRQLYEENQSSSENIRTKSLTESNKTGEPSLSNDKVEEIPKLDLKGTIPSFFNGEKISSSPLATPLRQNRSLAPPLEELPLASPAPNFSDQMASLTRKKKSNPVYSIVPPTSENNAASLEGRNTNETWEAYQNTLEYVTKHPTCALNLVCYRTGTKGCELHQIQTIKADRFENMADFHKMLEADQTMVYTDQQFFQALRDVYLEKMCGFWRRTVFLKTLRGLRLLSFTPTTRPTPVPLDDFVLQEVLYAYQAPSKVTTEHEWIDWVFRLRQPGRRHAIEFVEGWNGTRIAFAGSIPLVLSTVVGIAWSVKGSSVQDAFVVAGFILTAGSLLLALLAVISGIESSGGASR